MNPTLYEPFRDLRTPTRAGEPDQAADLLERLRAIEPEAMAEIDRLATLALCAHVGMRTNWTARVDEVRRLVRGLLVKNGLWRETA